MSSVAGHGQKMGSEKLGCLWTARAADKGLKPLTETLLDLSGFHARKTVLIEKRRVNQRQGTDENLLGLLQLVRRASKQGITLFQKKRIPKVK